jgi:hypothetical protein
MHTLEPFLKYYVSQTTVAFVDGKITATETILTRPDLERPTREMLRRMERIGIENIAVCKHTPKRYKMLTDAANKRRKAARDLTVAEVAEIAEEINKDAS